MWMITILQQKIYKYFFVMFVRSVFMNFVFTLSNFVEELVRIWPLNSWCPYATVTSFLYFSRCVLYNCFSSLKDVRSLIQAFNATWKKIILEWRKYNKSGSRVLYNASTASKQDSHRTAWTSLYFKTGWLRTSWTLYLYMVLSKMR